MNADCFGRRGSICKQEGYGLGEEIYQECLEIELALRSIPFRAKQELACFYKGHELRKRYVGHKGSLEWKRMILSEFIPKSEP